MDVLLQKILNRTNDKTLRSSRKIKLWGILIFTLLITCMQLYVQKDYVTAASGIRIYNYTTKKEYTYTDMQIKVTYNGKKISVDSTPGLLENNIALVSYKDIFAKSVIKADCVYDKAAQTVTISKFGTTIVLKIGSKNAYVNGKAVTAPVAPVKIKYVKENVTKILVPSRFVFENLGYNYTWHKSTSTVAVERKNEPMLLTYNDGDAFYYSGTQGKVTIDGVNVDLGKMPSIITNNTAMLRAKRVFADSKINAKYKYNANDKSITLSRNGNTLVMKIGSPVAYLNDRAIVLDTAPMIVTNHDAKTSYVMVPGSFTASCLGLDYRWDKNSMTSILTSRKDENPSAENPQSEQKPDDKNQAPNPNQDNVPEQNNEPELGDSPVTWNRGTILQQWEGNNNLVGVSSGVQNIDSGNISDTYGIIYSVSKDYSDTRVNTETYAVLADKPIEKVTSELIGKQIRLNVSNMSCIDNTYYLSGIVGSRMDSLRIYNADNMSSILEFNIRPDQFSYDLRLSPDKHILYITVYYNYLKGVTVGTNDDMDYITLTGDKPLDVNINYIPGLLIIDIPEAKSIEDNYVNILDAKNLNYVNLYTSVNAIMYLGLKDDIDYYIAEDGNNLTIMLPSKDKPYTPVIPEYPEDKPITEYPTDNLAKYGLVIPNPAGLRLSQISHEDQYSKLRFSIRIPGDYTSYLTANPILCNSAAVSDISVFLNSDYETEILVTTKELQGYELHADSKYIYVKMGRPRDIYKNIVVLDPGHGGTAPGARYFNTNEKAINFKILYEIGKDFFNSDPSQLKVYYTRESDVDISLADRAAYAEKIGADLFVSLHMNANTNASIYGTEIYYSNDNNKMNSAGLNSEMLAKFFVDSLSSSLGTKNRGTRAAKYTVVHRNTVPAILIELGFMSNKSDFDKISNPEFQHKAAMAIYETLLQIFELYPTGR
ncbi:MAG: hypothetical protein GX379_02735 [Clostridiales bacterium]|jgi:N-acetylmuramoyl-L-alanine amidase|nr:hypothetical protein [Clostridiales bacterium]